MKKALILFAKYPVPGSVKTRLARSIGSPFAVAIYREFVRHIITKYRSAAVADQLIVAVAREADLERFSSEFPGADEYISQALEKDLGIRMQKAMQQTLDNGFTKVVVLGTDSPNLPLRYLQSAFDLLDHHDVVIGPAEDGGYYLLATKAIYPELFENIPWSTDSVLSITLKKLEQNRISSRLLPVFYDVDDLESLKRLACDAPEILLRTGIPEKAFEETGMQLRRE